MNPFQYNRPKALAVLHFIGERIGFNRMRVQCVLYAANKTHISSYGRPVLGGAYKVKMIHPEIAEFYPQMHDMMREAPDYDELSGTDEETMQSVCDDYLRQRKEDDFSILEWISDDAIAREEVSEDEFMTWRSIIETLDNSAEVLAYHAAFGFCYDGVCSHSWQRGEVKNGN